jgi:hypothetical protein
MSPELVVVVGVLVGALLTGGVQTLQRERERRVGARVAARLFTGDLARASFEIGHVVEDRHSPDNIMPTFSRELEIWAEHRHAFAAVVDATDWTFVANAYNGLDDLAEVAVSNPLTERQLAVLRETWTRLDKAIDIVAERSAPRHQRARLMAEMPAQRHPEQPIRPADT